MYRFVFFLLILLLASCTALAPATTQMREPMTPTRMRVFSPASEVPISTPSITAERPAHQIALQVIGHIGGTLGPVAIGYPYAYVGAPFRGLFIVDVSDPHALRLVGEYEAIPRVVDIVLRNPYAYILTAANSLWVLDMTTPTAPREVGILSLPNGTPKRLRVRDGFAYIASGEAGLQIVAVHDPRAPRRMGIVDTPGDARSIAVADHYVYLADAASPSHHRNAGLRVIDVSDPSRPHMVASLDMTDVEDVAVVGDYAYLVAYDPAHYRPGLRVLDISDPAHPREVATYTPPTLFMYSRIKVVEGYALMWGEFCELGACRSGWAVVDVHDPTAPRAVRNIPENLGLVYAASDTDLEVLDFSRQGDVARVVGALELTLGSVDEVAVSGAYAYLILDAVSIDRRRLGVIDVHDPAHPIVLGTWPIPRECEQCLSLPGDLVVTGDFAYLSLWQDGLQIIDIRDPKQPRLRGHLDMDEREEWGIQDLVEVDGYIYAVMEGGDLHIADVQDPDRPRLVNTYPLEARAFSYGRIAVAGDYAYLVGGGCSETACNGGMLILNVSEPKQPHQVGWVEVPGAMGVAVAGKYAYVASAKGEIWVVDVSDPTSPRKVAVLPTGNRSASMIAVDNRYLYWGDQIIDISDPTQPRRVGMSDLLGDAVDISGGLIYVAGKQAGLLILHPSPAR